MEDGQVMTQVIMQASIEAMKAMVQQMVQRQWVLLEESVE